MLIRIQNLNLHYHASGVGKPLVLLHGWGVNLTTFAPIHAHLEQHFRAYSLDFPGFGQSDPPPVPWGTEEYANIVREFLHALNIDAPILIGHSFGGRIAIRLAASQRIPKMILFDSAGIRPKRSLKYYGKVYAYKTAKALLTLPGLKPYGEPILERFRKQAGSQDYQHTSGVMRSTFIKVVNEDLRDLLPKISASTLLIWGENDTATPVSDGRLMEQLIPDAGLVALKNAGHYVFADRLPQVRLIVDNFLKNEMQERTTD